MLNSIEAQPERTHMHKTTMHILCVCVCGIKWRRMFIPLEYRGFCTRACTISMHHNVCLCVCMYAYRYIVVYSGLWFIGTRMTTRNDPNETNTKWKRTEYAVSHTVVYGRNGNKSACIHTYAGNAGGMKWEQGNNLCIPFCSRICVSVWIFACFLFSIAYEYMQWHFSPYLVCSKRLARFLQHVYVLFERQFSCRSSCSVFTSGGTSFCT